MAGVKIGSGRRSDSRSPCGQARRRRRRRSADSPSSRSPTDTRARRTRWGRAWSCAPASRGPPAARRAAANGAGIVAGSVASRWLGTMSVVRREPECRQLREHLALVGDAAAEHVVEGRDTIGGHDDERRSGVEQIANLAPAIGLAPVEKRGHQRSRRLVTGGNRWSSGRKGGILSTRVARATVRNSIDWSHASSLIYCVRPLDPPHLPSLGSPSLVKLRTPRRHRRVAGAAVVVPAPRQPGDVWDQVPPGQPTVPVAWFPARRLDLLGARRALAAHADAHRAHALSLDVSRHRHRVRCAGRAAGARRRRAAALPARPPGGAECHGHVWRPS